MHFTTLLSTTALALTANAFLIPLEIADDVKAAKGKVADGVSSIFHDNSKPFTLDCSSCPFALNSERNGVHEWTNDVKSDLKMIFAAKDKHLTLNGEPFYPVTIKDLPGALYAPQVKKDSKSDSIFKGFQKGLKLSYALEFENVKVADGNELLKITMSILGIDDQMIRVDNVQIKAIKQADGTLSLVDISAVPASPNDAKCTNMMCRVLTKLNAAIGKARAKAASAAAATSSAAKKVKYFCMHCFHRLAGHPATIKEHDQPTRLPTHIVTRPGEFRMPHGHRHHRGIFHSMLGFARHLFTFVLLPVMVGVAVGITASAIGLLVGQAVVFLWMKYRHSGDKQQGAYQSVETEDKENGLPAYDSEALPPYMDIDEKKDVEQKA